MDQDPGKIPLHFSPLESQEAPRGLKDRNIDGQFVARPQKTPQVYKKIMSTKSRAPHAPVLSFACCEDWNLLKLSKAHGFGDDNSWLSVPTQQKDLLLKHDDIEHDAWFFSCGTGGGSA